MSTPPVLHIRSLTKTFPGTTALDTVDLEVRDGEIHALVGQNGSGKSTLIKVLAGYHRPDPGSRILLCGEQLTHETVAAHHRLRFVHQDLGLFLELSAVDNLALRSEFLTSAGRIRWRRQTERTLELLADFAVDLDVRAPLSAATPVQRTVVAIAAALAGWDGGAGLLVLDEPTAVLPPAEATHLLEIVEGVRARGTSILYVSHRLDEVLALADRVTVLRGGKLVETRPVAGLDAGSLATLMAGDDVDAGYRADLPPADGRRVALTARGLTGRYLDGVSLEVREGEVLGIAGLPGSGATELAHVLAGTVRGAGGEVALGVGPPVPVAKAARLNLPIVPSDRLRDAILPSMSVAENLSISILDRLRSGPVLAHHRERHTVARWMADVRVKAAGATAPIATLSGGNQQKVIIARCLAREPDVLLLCDPAAGVDPAARQAIYEMVAERARVGMALIVTSADIGDLLALCTRVLVLAGGHIVRELTGPGITEHGVIRAMEETELT
ncbi:sugar ABC transporter ATP-binding protein [Amycolatopsis pithecellobii]|uniref:ATP-binding cassette domain-containing protein n=1 Tax=Amycolatopsis pithecellobii TaxID=664692 RepID=A0A6N7YR16_9PSEU|nr:sugar ABC transporter ATP-binding protein [Amycolatopsis pithecellobii]MTD54328.1 ATP-binding cassette domain-containing protein [Amycolatopsis pithecellobii]